MEGEQMPKATMTNFIKGKLNQNFSAEFVNKILYLSKQFIVRLADKSNQICLQGNKKTINVEHLESALQFYGLKHHISHLKEVGNSIKQLNQLKRENSQRIQEDLQRQRREQNDANPEGEIRARKVVEVRERFQEIALEEVDQNDYDYEQLQNGNKIERVNQPQEESESEKDK